MIKQGSIISYLKMCEEEGVNLQRGMNFHLNKSISIILMNSSRNAPYNDKVEHNGRLLIYEGHDISNDDELIPKETDQKLVTKTGKLTQNGKFYKAAQDYKIGLTDAEIVKVYEKIRAGIWVFNGLFKLVNAYEEFDGTRKVYKFQLEIIEDMNLPNASELDIEHNRLIPSHVKLAVWERDKGRCVKCGSTDNLHFDHVIPFSKGGSSLIKENIQLLCARHNLQKHDKIE